MSTFTSTLGVLSLVCLIALPVAQGEELAVRAYPLPGHESLQLGVPKSWQEEVRRPAPELPPTITFREKEGAAFRVMLTPMWSAREDRPLPGPEQIRQSVQRSADGARAQAVEETIPVEEIKGPSCHGYKFSATDRAPEPGGFKYMTQGMLRVGELLVTFTILTNDGQEKIAADALAALRTMVQAPATQPTRIPIPGAGWEIRFESPKLSAPEESGKAPVYTFRANADRFNISLFVEPPQGAGSTHEACYQHYWRKASRNSDIIEKSVTLSPGKKYYRVQYDCNVAGMGLRMRHVNYYFVFQGKWVDVHISIIAPTKADAKILAAFDQSLTYERTAQKDPVR